MYILIKMLFLINFITNNTQEIDCNIISEIIKNEKVLNYLHPELNSRSKLYISKNEICNLNQSIGKIELIVINEKDLKNKKNYIKITSIKQSNKGKIISMSYPIEGAAFKIHVDKNDKIIKVEIIEK